MARSRRWGRARSVEFPGSRADCLALLPCRPPDILVANPIMKINALFAEAPLRLRCFLWLRSVLTPYDRLAATLPSRGWVVDLGSGHGLLALALSRGSPQREILGIDHDHDRVRLAATAALSRPVGSRPRFEVGDLKEKLGSFASGSLAGIAMIDILHYFDPANQQLLVSEAARVLMPDGMLVVREIDSDAGIKA